MGAPQSRKTKYLLLLGAVALGGVVGGLVWVFVSASAALMYLFFQPWLPANFDSLVSTLWRGSTMYLFIFSWWGICVAGALLAFLRRSS